MSCGLRSSSASNWWLRSANNVNNFRYVKSNGDWNNNNANNSYGVALGSSLARQSNSSERNLCRRREGEYNPPPAMEVNTYLDEPERTLLAWRWLMVNPSFHAQWFYAAIATIRFAVQGISLLKVK